MDSEAETLRREVNRNLDDLNTYLVEVEVEPVSKLAVDGIDVQTTSPARLRETLDYLDVPSYADSRIDPILHRILKQLTVLEGFSP